jgi:hypothetical protein
MQASSDESDDDSPTHMSSFATNGDANRDANGDSSNSSNVVEDSERSKSTPQNKPARRRTLKSVLKKEDSATSSSAASGATTTRMMYTQRILSDAPSIPTTPTVNESEKKRVRSEETAMGSMESMNDQESALESVLEQRVPTDIDEYRTSDIEELVNRFVEIHPMMNHSLSSDKGYELLSKLGPNGILPSMPVVGRSYEQSQLRPPNINKGERECICGTNCICRFMGFVRYGDNDPRTFVCKEFLLPFEQEAWEKGQRLPEVPKKCLICLRYWNHVTKIRMQMDPTYRATYENVQLVAYRNEVQTHTNRIEDSEGYPMDMMLFADESTTKSCGNDSCLWQPFVGFHTHHYYFTRDSEGNPYVKQIIRSSKDDLNEKPSSSRVECSTAISVS